MADLKSHRQKVHTKATLDGTTGVKGIKEYQVYGETTLRVTTSGVGGTNDLEVQVRLESQSSWTTLGSVTGASSSTFDISTYDYIRFNVATADSTGEVIASGFFNQVGSLSGGSFASFATIQTDAGTSPVADSAGDTLTITSTDSTITVTGTAATDTVDLTANITSLETLNLNGGNGSLAADGLTFNDGDSGIWETADDILSIDTLGTQAIEINASQQVELSAELVVKDSASSADYSIVRSGVSDHGIAFNGALASRNMRINSDSYTIDFNKNGITAYVGTSYIRVNGTGTAAAPIYSFRGDTNTGLYSPGSDQICLVTGGVAAVSVGTTQITTFTAQINLPSFTVATLPAATTAGGFIFVSDETGGAVTAFSDGTNWRRTTDRVVVS